MGPTSLVEDRERREISQAWGSFLNSDGFELDIRHHNSGVPHGHGEMTLLADLKTNYIKQYVHNIAEHIAYKNIYFFNTSTKEADESKAVSA